MCREKVSPKCCIDNILLIFVILIMMLLYMYIETKNQGLIAIIVVMTVFTLIVFSIRLEECGCPDWIKNCKKMCKNICRDRLVDDDEETKENQQ